MRLRILVIFVLLPAVISCTPMKTYTQTGQVTIPVLSTTGRSVPLVKYTAVAACTCPSGSVATAQPQGGINGPALIICNCPAIIVQTQIQSTEVDPTSQSTSGSEITLKDNGKIITMLPGESFLLDLGMDTYDWTVDIDNQNVLSRLLNVMVIRGAQGIYEAHVAGQARLSVRGDPFCRKAVPMCGMPSMLFEITVIVH